MAFKNEKIPEQDREWLVKLVTYQNVKAISRGVHGVHNFEPLTRNWWTANREQNAYFIPIGGGGRPDDVGRMPYTVLIMDRQVVLVNDIRRWSGNVQEGIDALYEIHNLTVPDSLKHRREEIERLLRDAYEEYARCNPLAEGGTFTNPNMTARWNIKSVTVEFK